MSKGGMKDPWGSDNGGCSEGCFLKGDNAETAVTGEWSTAQTALLRSSAGVLKNNPRCACLIASIINKPCAEVTPLPTPTNTTNPPDPTPTPNRKPPHPPTPPKTTHPLSRRTLQKPQTQKTHYPRNPRLPARLLPNPHPRKTHRLPSLPPPRPLHRHLPLRNLPRNLRKILHLLPLLSPSLARLRLQTRRPCMHQRKLHLR